MLASSFSFPVSCFSLSNPSLAPFFFFFFFEDFFDPSATLFEPSNSKTELFCVSLPTIGTKSGTSSSPSSPSTVGNLTSTPEASNSFSNFKNSLFNPNKTFLFP
ncbi:hypothetical protein HanXRQr2_Chr13g0586421 [Helianthus annuus]|uniref:Uncharacterized protein n=1 Tax=Helianthus annuus TaxID=4232 RepID=A0A9K3EHL3_HELAN|nr:hypothetical protein HanXRQr2_Chr13g0586421 [Helianthus annuus]